MSDILTPTFEEVAKALEQKVKDLEAAFDALSILKFALEDKLINAQNKNQQLREPLRTSEKVRTQAVQLFFATTV